MAGSVEDGQGTVSSDWRFAGAPLTFSGPRVKAGLHCHTVHSDGGLSPAETVSEYRSKGYQCLAITDHFGVTPTAPFSDEGFVGIDGTENGGYPDVIGIGASRAVPPDGSLAERAGALARQGAFTIAAHPTYCAATPDTYLSVPDLMALEICNAYCHEAYSNGLATELWDMLLGQGKRVWGVAADDAHLNQDKRYYSHAGRAWVEIWASALTRAAILDALKRGAFFSTRGPRFERIEVRANLIEVTCSPVREVRWRTFGKVGFVDYAAPGSALTRSALPSWYRPTTFVRIELVDDQGRKAWSNPVYVS